MVLLQPLVELQLNQLTLIDVIKFWCLLPKFMVKDLLLAKRRASLLLALRGIFFYRIIQGSAYAYSALIYNLTSFLKKS